MFKSNGSVLFVRCTEFRLKRSYIAGLEALGDIHFDISGYTICLLTNLYLTLICQCYVWMKKRPLPILIEFSVTDMMESLRPDIVYYESYEEAHKAAVELESQFDKTLSNSPDQYPIMYCYTVLCIGYLTSSYDVTTQPANGVTNVNSKQSLSDEEDDEYHRKGNKSKKKSDMEELQDELVILKYFVSKTIS